MKKLLLFFTVITISVAVNAQTDTELITATLNDYIEGTANGNTEQVKKAFHQDLNLYSIRNGKLSVWFGQDYIGNITEGRKTGRTGEILSIDYENDVASAKVEIIIPGRSTPIIDFFLLAKIEGHWTILHKGYTSKTSAD